MFNHLKEGNSKTYQELKKRTRGKPHFPTYIYSPIQIFFDFLQRSFRFLLILILLFCIFMGGIASGILYGYIHSTAPIPAELFALGNETSYVYDKNENIISKQTGILNIDRHYIHIADVKNTYIDDAFISIEDERFESHIGIDPKRIGSAVLSALANGGTPTHGGSTITQQVVKLITGNDQRSAQRKIQEWYRAVMLDHDLSKDEIMEIYLNSVPMGNSYIGIDSAAQGYFGKPASQLDLAESAFLAGLPNAPSLYNPRTENGLRNAFRRQRLVLSKMYELGKITKEEYEEARNEELLFKDSQTEISGTMINSYFTEYALQEAVDLLIQVGYDRSIAQQLVQNGGLHIYTSFNPDVQAALDITFNTQSLFQQNPELYVDEPEKPEAAMIVIDNETGNIAGMAGGYGKKTSNLVWNRAVNLERQPGSSIKPLVVYGPALQTGKYVGSSIIQDEEVFLNGKASPWPTNYDLKYRGPVTFRNALKGSLNVPAVKILQDIGVDTGKKYLKDVGIDWFNDPVQLAAAVGAPQTGVSPLLMAQAYATFPNQGVFRKAHAVTKIINKDGVVLYEGKEEGKRVYSKEIAYIMTTMLLENTRGITSNFNYLSDAGLNGFGSIHNGNGEVIPTAGKTGTTDSNNDKWFAAFTPYYTAALWYGFDNRIKQSVIPPADYMNALRIWHDAMRRIHVNLSPKEISPMPPNIVTERINIFDGKLANPDDPQGDTMMEYYVENSPLIPTEISDFREKKEEEEHSSDKLYDFSWLNKLLQP